MHSCVCVLCIRDLAVTHSVDAVELRSGHARRATSKVRGGNLGELREVHLGKLHVHVLNKGQVSGGKATCK